MQTSLSSQEYAAPPQDPSAQASPDVHATPSSQGAELKVLLQPEPGSHASSVQTSPSSQVDASGAFVQLLVPDSHVSMVQSMPSSQPFN